MTSYIIRITLLLFLISGTSKATSLNTQFESDGAPQYHSIFLDRHKLTCPNSQVLNAFRLVREIKNNSVTGKIRYEYRCVETKISGTRQEHTQWNDEGAGNTVYLDRHNVECRQGEAISEFRLVRKHNNGIAAGLFRYEYSCAEIKGQDTRELETPFSDDGGGANVFLDRHRVSCPDNGAINAFRLVRNGERNKYKYVYKCASYKPVKVDTLPLTNAFHKLLVNTTLSDLYATPNSRWIPKCTLLADYPANSHFSPDWMSTIAAVFPNASVAKNLPNDIKAQLNSNGVALADVDICFFGQINGNLGESDDHADGSTLTTRLKPHAWADPDAPAYFEGDRVNRNFLVGLFDVDDPNMQDEVRMNEMREFNVHTHDAKTSPRNMRIKIPNRRSHSFWSLVIDNHNPNGHKRALATLHWLIGLDDMDKGRTPLTLQEAWGDSKTGPWYINERGLKTSKVTYTPKFATWGDFYAYMRNDPKINTQAIVRKLYDLLYR